MKVIIAGAGSVGRSIAKDLQSHGHEVTLIDKQTSPKKQSNLENVIWLIADACELSVLAEAGAAEADVVVASTGDDKANLVISFLAKTEFAVPRTVARVSNPLNEWLYDASWGVDVAVSTPRIMTSLVEEAVSVGELVKLFTFQQAAAAMYEVTLPKDSPLAGTALAQLALPANVVLSCIIRGDVPLAPGPHHTLEALDELLFIVPEEADLAELKQALTGAPATK